MAARILEWWRDIRFRTLALVCLASIMERADEALLPSVYREIGIELHAGPSALGSLTLVRSLTQSLCAPLAGFLAQQYNRASIIAAGALMWAVATFFVGVSTTFAQVAVSRALNGVGLAVVGPAIQSMIADGTSEGNRGEAFGWNQVAGNLGSVFGGLCAVLMADKVILGVAGWRMAFHLVAILSIVVGFMVYRYAKDPQFAAIAAERKGKTFRENLREIYLDSKSVVQIRSFQLFVAQGVTGSFPWAALAFAPMWLELIGFTNEMTAALMGCFVVGTSMGGLFGGMMGDYLSVKLPNAGRIILSQISAALGIPVGAILLLVLPNDPATPFVHGFGFFFMGLCISWNASATNGPIFAEIVPEKSRTNVYALDRAFETVLASFAPPIVGLLAENVYGYRPPAKGTTGGRLATRDKENALALADALYTSISIPFVFCASIYFGLYWSYPKDRDRVRAMQGDSLQTVAHVPLEELQEKEEYIWTVGDEDEEDEDEDHDGRADGDDDDERAMMQNGARSDNVDSAKEGETVQMLPKH